MANKRIAISLVLLVVFGMVATQQVAFKGKVHKEEVPADGSSHAQSGNSVSRFSAHAQGSTINTGNYIWISCFTGFGEASLISINTIVDSQPTVDQCITRIAAERPNYTVQRLREAVDNYNRANPGSN